MPTIALYLICVAIWSTTWIAITFQLGTVAPLASVAWRFALASAVIFSWCAWRRLPLRFDGSRHRVLALQGLLMFGIGYTLVYEAEARVVSGLVAVGYSASPIVNALWGRLLYRTPLTGPILLGGLLGIAGVTAIFGLEIAAMTAGTRAFHGVLLTAAAVLIQGIATVSMGRNAQRRIGVWPALAWGMGYGALGCLLLALLTGEPLRFSVAPHYLGAWLYLALLGSVVAFGCYLVVIERIGAARASYVGVMVPIAALALSSAFEGYRWTAATWLGMILCVVGNWVVMTGSSRRPARKEH